MGASYTACGIRSEFEALMEGASCKGGAIRADLFDARGSTGEPPASLLRKGRAFSMSLLDEYLENFSRRTREGASQVI